MAFPGVMYESESSGQWFICIWFFGTHELHHARLVWTLPSWCITKSQSLLKLMSIELVMPSNHLILCCPLLLLHSIFPRIMVFFSVSVLCIRWPNYWCFTSTSVLPLNVQDWFRMGWLDLLAVQGTLKSLPQHHSSKVSILQCSAFLMVQLSHPNLTTGKTIALTS